MDSVIHLKEVDSTSTYLSRLVSSASCPGEGTVVWADVQTAGRGQRGNTWVSAQNENLTFSIVLYPEISVSSSFLLSQLVSLALVDTLDSFSISDAHIKWPNDIYIGERKVCGFIIDQSVSGDTVSDAVIGIGLNVNQKDFPADLPNPVSMSMASCRDYDLSDVLNALRTKLMLRYNQLLTGEYDMLRNDYLNRLFRYGVVARFVDASDSSAFNATIVDVLHDGKIVLQLTDGTMRTFAFKEVRFVFHSAGLSL